MKRSTTPMAKTPFIIFILFVVGANSQEAKEWALLVAGSNGYDNYRHQADVCHAYHVMKNHGIPDERIVVMMFDDIANATENPFKGNIINQPNGPNVYPGVLKDYTGNDVTPAVFLAVLTGNETLVEKLVGRNGKVIKSGPNDHIFVNFVDHGAPGLLAFPNAILYAKPLEAALKKMYVNKQYNKMVLYVEACESGSMFDSLLPKNINIFVTTAANPIESSFACYFDNERETYLGDVYSVNWMQDSDKENLKQETLQQQYNIVKKETNTSHVMEYGDPSIGKMKVADFQGDTLLDKVWSFAPHPSIDAVQSEKVPLMIQRHKFEKATTPQEKQAAAKQINVLLNHYAEVDELFEDIVGMASNYHLIYSSLKHQRLPISQWDCYQRAVDELMLSCPGIHLPGNDYALRHLYLLVNVCELSKDSSVSALLKVIRNVSHSRTLCAQ